MGGPDMRAYPWPMSTVTGITVASPTRIVMKLAMVALYFVSGKLSIAFVRAKEIAENMLKSMPVMFSEIKARKLPRV